VPKKVKDVQIESGAGLRSRAKKTARKRSPAKTSRPRKQAATKSGPDPKHAGPSDEQIRSRAYFIAEKRAKHSIKGDHHSDWLEARRQLLEEAGLPLH
jgi:hypothetical protein